MESTWRCWMPDDRAPDKKKKKRVNGVVGGRMYAQFA